MLNGVVLYVKITVLQRCDVFRRVRGSGYDVKKNEKMFGSNYC